MQAARKHEGKIYTVCDCQGIVKMVQKQETNVKLRKRLKEAYWNYLIMIQQLEEERKEENRGETEFVRIKSHMGRKGLLNKSHTEQDRRAEEIANDGERQAEKVPTPRG